jgi:hypothetical protein
LKKLLATAAVTLAALALGIAALSLPWRGTREGPPRLLSACRADGPLAAGAAELPIPLADRPSIAGFARLRWAAEGLRDPVAVRALVAGGPGCAVGLVSAEVLLVPEALAAAVAARVADLGLSGLVLGATHTHAGPGGHWDSFLGGRIATGPYDPRAFEALADTMARALRAAATARRPARLLAGVADVRDLVFSRAFEQVDGRLVSARFTAEDGSTIGEVAVLGAHPTLLGMRNRRISGDWPGALMRGRPAPLLFFQGALGDQTTLTPNREEGAVEAYGRLVAIRVDQVARSPAGEATPLALARAAVPLPQVSPGALPAWLRPAARTVAGGLLPGEAEVTALRLGPVVLVAVPAEPVAAVAERWRAEAGPGAEILSLAGGYAGYVETPGVMARGAGETPRTYYGPELAERLGAAVRLAAGAAGPGRPAQPAP